MSKTKRSSYPKSNKDFKNDPLFYEELAILKAQEKIAELMKNNNTSKTELAESLNQSKAHVTELLSDGRNLTLKTFARICFHLNAEIDFQTYMIGAKHSVKKLTSDKKLVSPYQLGEDWVSSIRKSISTRIYDKTKIAVSVTDSFYIYNKNAGQFMQQSGSNPKVA